MEEPRGYRHLQKICRNDGPVIYGNDANCSALAELWFGSSARNVSSFVFISEGLGAGMVIFHKIIHQAKAGAPAAIATLRDTGRYLGMGVSNIIKALDPEVVIVGGKIAQAWEIIYPELIQEISRRFFGGIKKSTRIVPASFAIRSSRIGAATLAIKEIFSGLQITP